jgi:hypothetical protein
LNGVEKGRRISGREGGEVGDLETAAFRFEVTSVSAGRRVSED